MASPAGRAPGQNGPGANRPLPPRRPVAKVNPLVQKKKPPPRPRQPAAPGPRPTSNINEPVSLASRPTVPGKRDLETTPFGDLTPSLFAKPPPPGQYTDYPIVVSKKALMDKLKHHVARLTSRKPVDLLNSTEFVRPLYLLRKDYRSPLPGTPEWEEMQAEQRRREEEGAGDVERNAAKEAAKAEIAPSLAKKKPKPIKKKAQQAYTKGETEAQISKGKLKYQEALPWHLEDEAQNQIWMGTYEDASSNIWTALKFENGPQGQHYVITPLQKWYKFLPKTRFSADELKKVEERKVKSERGATPLPSFLSAFVKQEETDQLRDRDHRAAAGEKFYVGKIAKGGANFRNDDEELDFEEDFADDEAPPEMEGEEDEVKDVEQRIKKDQLKSNFFDNRDLKDYEADEEREEQEKKMFENIGKKTARALHKRERNALYERDEENPYSSGTDSTDTEAEIERERERKEAEAKAAAAAANAPVKIKTEPGSRNSTPGNRPSKHPDPLRKHAQNLKRPGSPNLSEASGNESTAARKKIKTKNPTSKLANIPSRTHSPAPSANGGRPVPGTNRSFAAGSGSDTEGGASRKLKLTSPRSPTGSPGPSRMASRAGSPVPGGAVKVKKEKEYVPFPNSSEDLRALIPPEGIPMPILLNRFSNLDQDTKKQRLVRMVQEVARYDKQTKLLLPKTTKPAVVKTEEP